MTELVLVSCSKTKRRGTYTANHLYEPSAIFRKRRRLARARGDHWGVLSAKHGYLRPWDVVDYYQCHISERSSIWAAFVLCDLLRDLKFYDVDTVTVLAGKRYVDPLVAPLEVRGYDVVDFNRGLAQGERQQALDRAMQRRVNGDLTADEWA